MRWLLVAALVLTACTSNAPEPTRRAASLTAPAPTAALAPDRDRPWDPRRVDQLPAAAAGVAGGLPRRVEPPASLPELADDPMRAAVLSGYVEDAVVLMSAEGQWRRVPAPAMGSFGGAELTRDGTRVAVETADGVDVWDLPTGERTRIPHPEDARPWDFSSWRWIDRETLLLDDARGGWRVDVASGAVQRTPYPSSTSFWWTVDPAGAVVESADWSHPNLLTDWAAGVGREVDMAPTGRLSSLHAGRDVVVGTSYDAGPFGVYVADRSDLTPRHVLRVRDHEANYSNGGLSVLALLADGTVLLRVAVLGGRDVPLRVVAWAPGSGDLSLVSRIAGSVELLSVADGLLG